MPSRRYRFRPGLWPTLVTLAVLPLLIALGFWQIHRAHFKKGLHDAFLARETAPAVRLNDPDSRAMNASAMHWHEVVAEGHYDPDHQFLLDNQVYKMAAGYLVLTPFRIAGSDAWVLVNRGWLPLGESRAVVPNVEVSSKTTEIRGLAVPFPAAGIRLAGDARVQALGPEVSRIERVSVPQISRRLHRHILPYLINLDPGEPNGYHRQRAVPGSDEPMHLGYAFQWFALAVTLVVIYIATNLQRLDKAGRPDQ